MHSKVLILDFGSQFTQIIARRTRELGVYSEIQPFNYNIETIKADKNIKAIILSGGPNSVYQKDAPDIDPNIFELGIPILGTCYGMQIIAHKLGASVEKAKSREYGRGQITVVQQSPLTTNIENQSEVWMSHGDHLTSIPKDFELILSSVNCPISGIANKEKKIYAVQFHPEVYHSGKSGKTMISNFLFNIAKVKSDWNSGSYVQEQCLKIQKQVGKDMVLCGLSGGVDSAVTAALIHKAIPGQIHCVFVDNGLLRYKEKNQVKEAFSENFKIKLTIVDAAEVFLFRLQGVVDPETKRKIIGNTFIEIFELSTSHLAKEIMVNKNLEITVLEPF